MKLLLALVLLAASTFGHGPSYIPLGCLLVDPRGRCLQCDQSNLYYLSGNFCAKNFDPNCRTIDQLGSCTLCTDGYYSSSFGFCFFSSVAENCMIVDPSNPVLCQTCLPGFFAVAGICVPSIPNCSFFDSASGHCVLCLNGFLLRSTNTCVRDIPLCKTWTVDGLCGSCLPPYGVTHDGLQCLVTIPGCVLYKADASYCFSCAQGRELSPDGSKCFAPISNCQAYAISVLTVSGYVCTQCEFGFYLTADRQVCVAYDNQYCVLWDATYTRCLNCIPSFVWDAVLAHCIFPVAHCQLYELASPDLHWPQCSQCNPGFFIDPSNNLCSAHPVCGQGHIFCQATFTCVAIPSCCASYDLCGNCQSFKPATGWCPETNSCFTYTQNCPGSYNCLTGSCDCPAGETWCALAASCVAVPSCCLTDDGCGNCVTLLPGHGMCPATQQCFLVSPVCPDNFECETGLCLCQPGYYWSEAYLSCKEAPRCCDGADGTGNCLAFRPNSGWCAETDSCFYFPPGCPEGLWDCVANVCNCPDGQSWCPRSETCMNIPPCCEASDHCGGCLTTLPGWVHCLATNECLEVSLNCTNFDCVTGECFDQPNPCAEGETFCNVVESCVEVPSCCLTHDDCGNCLTTIPGTSYCTLTATCYEPPADCGHWDCVNQVCEDRALCGWGQTFCPRTSTCVDVPFCCLDHDDCGGCLSTLPFTGVCPQTNRCYFNVNCHNYDCENNLCLDVATTCPVGQTLCPATATCNPVPPCCATHDSCGNCLTLLPNTGFCGATGQCYVAEPGCPAGNYDCVAQRCVCGPGASWCGALSQCVEVPPCCLVHDDCGNCLGFQPGQNFCPMNEQCFGVPVARCVNFDCVNGVCLDGSTRCSPGSTFCPLTNTCLPVPGCCLTFDACGNCLTTVPGMGWCQFTGRCYLVDPSCNNYDCLTNTCLDSQRCGGSQAYCPETESCSVVPPCCLVFDPCHGCLKFAPGTNWCAATNRCYFQFSFCGSFDCLNQVCNDLTCLPSQTYCPASHSCVDIPTCCSAYDNCGHCLETKPGWLQCETQACLHLPHDCLVWDCASDSCSVSFVCPAGQIHCAETRQCVAIPPCCQSYDACGRCNGFFPGTGWCASTSSCFVLPHNCVQYDCLSETCISNGVCPSGQEYCLTAQMCVPIPSCCELTDGCGVCLTYKEGHGWCSQTSSCFARPPGCQVFDCVAHVCLDSPNLNCTATKEFCQRENRCVEVPSCCDLTDGCGMCLTYKPNTGWCSDTDRCYTKPAGCLIFDCERQVCVQNVTCPPNFGFCAALNECVEVPSCCATHNGCGECTTYKQNQGWCSPTDSCYTMPGGCILYDCESKTCAVWTNCASTQSYCPDSATCVEVPACCQLHNDCAHCTTYKPNTGWCSATQSCYSRPADCVNYDCILGRCVDSEMCGEGQAFCLGTRRCYDVPNNCPPGHFDCAQDSCRPCPSGTVHCPAYNSCQAAVPNCQTQAPCGLCSQCLAGFFWNGFECERYPAIPNCWVQVNNQCTQCLLGFVLSGNSCSLQPPNCESLGGAVCAACNSLKGTVCLSCNPEFVLSSGACFPVIPNCAAQAATTCSQCLPNFVLFLNRCQPEIPDCLVPGNQTCLSCVQNFIFFPNPSNPAGGSCHPALPNCAVQKLDICHRCNPSFVLQNNFCYHEVTHCLFYDASGCIRCPANFVLTARKCHKIIPNCAIQNATVCTRCVSEFALSRGACVLLVPNCAAYVDGECIQCLGNFVLHSGQCFPRVPFCEVQVGASCASCSPNYILDFAIGDCFAATPNCQSYANRRCTACQPKFLFEADHCITAIQHCQLQTGATCHSCVSPWVLFNNFCWAAIWNCALQTGPVCSSCAAKFTLSNNACYASIANCALLIEGLCYSCFNGFVLTHNVCVQDRPFENCSLFAGATCLACNVGFFLSSGFCVPNFCSNFNQLLRVCAACLYEAPLVNGTCVYIEGCRTYNLNGAEVTCAACSATFVSGHGGRSCLGPAHFILAEGSSVSHPQPIGLFGRKEDTGLALAWGQIALGTPQTIWYFSRYSTGFYTIKLATQAAVGGPVQNQYLAADGKGFFLTSFSSHDQKAFWAMNVQSVSLTSMWSFRSVFTHQFLAPDLAASSSPVYINVT